jgi:LPXTG-motif cell wall-anchored protein
MRGYTLRTMRHLLLLRRLLATAGATLALLVLAALPALAAEIELTDDGFEPDEVTVDVGETVVWTNATDEEHTIVGQDGSWDSGPLAPGETFSVSLRSEGTVDYATEDDEHEGRILVVEGGAAAGDDDGDEEGEATEGESAEVEEEAAEPSLPDTGVAALPMLLTGLVMVAGGGLMVRRFRS